MHKFSKCALSALAAAASVALFSAAPVMAQDVTTKTIGAWTVQCSDAQSADGNYANRAPAGCSMFQERDGFRMIGVQTSDNRPDPALTLLAPIATSLKPGIRLQIDGDTPISMGFDFCVGNGCIAYRVLDADLREQLATGEMATVSFDRIGQTFGHEFPLDGFVEGLEALRPWD